MPSVNGQIDLSRCSEIETPEYPAPNRESLFDETNYVRLMTTAAMGGLEGEYELTELLEVLAKTS